MRELQLRAVGFRAVGFRAVGFRAVGAAFASAAAITVLLAGCGSPTPTKPHAPASSPAISPAPAGPGAPPAGRPADYSPLTAAQLSRLPRFGPPPTPERVIVAHGPSAGWYSAVPTRQRVAFITIDDGWTKTREALPLLRAAHVPVTLFLEINAIKPDTAYFARLQQAGAVIEAHTITHTELRGKPYAQQKHEICGSADQLATLYGRRPVLFRPPYGTKDATTLRAVHDCGMKAAFFWKETTHKGKVRYQEGHAVKAGDIILMHFRPAFVADFTAVLRAIAKAGLTPALLEDYVG